MPDIFHKAASVAQEMIRQGVSRPYYRALAARNTGGEVLIDGRQVVMAGCNDYLGLATDPRVAAAAATAVERFGASCSGSRVLNGTLTLHVELEERLAEFLGCEAALVATTGFQANQALAALFGRGDVVFGDQANHASLVEAARLGFARHIRFRHRDTGHLARLMAATEPTAAKLILTDGMFSMEGDLCPLPELARLAREHGARLAVDGAHDIGLLGAGARGVGEHFGLLSDIDLFTGTFSKCFGSVGGFLAGPAGVVEHLRWAARSVIFSAAMPPPAVAAALAALDIVQSEPERRRRVFRLAGRLNNGLRSMGFDTGHTATPVVPVRIGSEDLCFRLWQELFDLGIFVNAVITPAVPRGAAILRVTPQATHSDAQVNRILDAFEQAGRRTGLTSAPKPTEFAGRIGCSTTPCVELT